MWCARWQVKIAVAVAVAGGACGGAGTFPSAINRDNGIPIRTSEVHGPGTVLGEGLSVPPGAVLAGAALPQRVVSLFDGHRVAEESWTAILGVGGAPRDVARVFLAQARRADFRRLPGEPFCDDEGCEFSNESGTAGSLGGRYLNVRVESRGREGAWASVRFTDRGGTESAVSYPRLQSQGVPPLPIEPAPGRLPSTGDPIELPDWTATVVDGTEMIMPVVTAAGGSVAILRVRGDAEEAFEAYLHQMDVRDVAGVPVRADGTRIGGWAVSTATTEGSRVVELLTQGRRSYIRITEAND